MDKREFSGREILAGEASQNAPVTIKGWVHPAGLEGGHFVRTPVGRLVVEIVSDVRRLLKVGIAGVDWLGVNSI
jgi:hypothetical protein